MWQKYSLRGFSVLLRCAQPQNIFFALIHMYLCTCSKHTVPFKLPVNVDFIQAVKVTKSTVPLKCKLKVSTRFSILDSRSSKFSRIKNLVLRLKFRVRFSRFENQVSRIEFRGTWSIFRGSWTEISRKWFNLQKQNNSPLWKRVIAWERSRAASGYEIIWGDADRNKQEEFSAEFHSVDCL